MPTKKKESTQTATRKKSTAGGGKHRGAAKSVSEQESYDVALKGFGEAVDLLRGGNFEKARDRFTALAVENADESEFADRSRTYAAICERKLAPQAADPDSIDELYYLGVVRSNEGRLDEAISLLDRAVEKSPDSSKVLYARATVHALQDRSDAAVADLRAAVVIEPTLRFQAANDPDFESVRDDAAFIDIVEPTPSEI